jgi:hypothetical protein
MGEELLMLRANLINTPLQRGGGAANGDLNRFSGLQMTCAGPGQETAKAVHKFVACPITSLKRGVNEKAA